MDLAAFRIDTRDEAGVASRDLIRIVFATVESYLVVFVAAFAGRCVRRRVRKTLSHSPIGVSYTVRIGNAVSGAAYLIAASIVLAVFGLGFQDV